MNKTITTPLFNKTNFLFFLILFFTCSSKIIKAQCCATVTSTKSCNSKQTGTATVTPCGPGNYYYQWDDANAQTTSVATGLAAGVYHVTITNGNLSCPFSVTVTDTTCTPYIVPNVITPNGDGVNDYFAITGLESGTKVTIYNSWGAVVYSSANYDNDWGATNVTEGVYFYVLNRPNAELHTSTRNDPSRGFIQIFNGR